MILRKFPFFLLALSTWLSAESAAASASRRELFDRVHAEHSSLEAPAADHAEYWRSFRNGFRNQGRSPVAVRSRFTESSGRVPRGFATSGLIWGTPVIDQDGRVFVGSADKVFYCLETSGAARWTYTLPDAGDSLIDSAAVLAPNNLVVVPGGDGHLHALDRDTGALKWRFKAYHADDHDAGHVVNSFEGNVTIGPDGFLYAGSDNGHLYSLDLEGKERWNIPTGMMIWTAAAFHQEGNWFAFGSLDKSLYVADMTTGQKIASFSGSGEFKCSPAMDDQGRLYVGNSDFVFRCLELGKSFWGNPALKVRWSFTTGGEIYSSAAVAGDRVIFGSHDGFLYCLDTDGQLVWKYGIHARISGSPLVTADGVVIVGAKNGKLYAIDVDSGKRLWSFKPTQGLRKVNLDSSPALGPDGMVHLGSYDGKVYSVPVEYPLQNPQDPRVDLDPGDDLPDFGSEPPQGGVLRFVDRQGALSTDLAEPIGIHNPITLRLVTMEEGKFVPNAAIAATGLTVEIDPAIPLDVVVSSDSYQLNVFPQRPFDPSTTYTLKVSGRYYHRRNPFVDLLKWWSLPKVTFSGQFTTQPLQPGETSLTPGEELRYTVEGMYATQPEILDTLIPAAMDGQAYIVSAPFIDADKGALGLMVLPGFPRPDGVVIRPSPEKAFPMSGAFVGRSIRASGSVHMGAMGATLPLSPIRFHGRLGAQGLEEGTFYATGPGWGVRGNGGFYTGISWVGIDDLVDWKLQLQVLGTIEGKRLEAPTEVPALEKVAWTASNRLEATMVLPGTMEVDHLVTACFWDTAAAKFAAQVTVVVPKGSSGTLTLPFTGLKRSALEKSSIQSKILFDGRTLQ